MGVEFDGNYRSGDWGFIDKTGKSKYDYVANFREGLAAVRLNKKWGFIDKTQKEVVPPRYDDILFFFSEGLASVQLNKKWGFIDKTSKEVIPLKYDDARAFKQGVAMIGVQAQPRYRYGLINTSGKEILAPRYDFIYDPVHGVAAHELNGKMGLTDIATGKEILPSGKYDELDPTYLSEGLIKAGTGERKDNRKYGLTDKTGKEIVPLIYDEIRKFKNGKVVVSIGKHPNRKAGMIDKTGKEIVPLKYKTLWDDFSVGRALFQTVDDTFGFIDETGREAIPPLTQYRTVNSFQAKVALAKVFVGKSPNSKGGFIDNNGKEVVAPKYDQLGAYFSDGLLSVGIGAKAERKFGYIDPTGKEVIPLIYKRAEVFKSGRARVTDFNNRTFYIDKTGKEVQ